MPGGQDGSRAPRVVDAGLQCIVYNRNGVSKDFTEAARSSSRARGALNRARDPQARENELLRRIRVEHFSRLREEEERVCLAIIDRVTLEELDGDAALRTVRRRNT